MANNIQVCPHCNDERIHRQGTKWRCGRCFVEFEKPATRIMAVSADAAAAAKETLSGEGIIVDHYRETTLTGEEVERTVVRYVRPAPEKYIPDLAIKEKRALFCRWLYRERNKREHRWGRNWIRKQGYVPFVTVEWKGKDVVIYVPGELPADEIETFVQDWLHDFGDRLAQ